MSHPISWVSSHHMLLSERPACSTLTPGTPFGALGSQVASEASLRGPVLFWPPEHTVFRIVASPPSSFSTSCGLQTDGCDSLIKWTRVSRSVAAAQQLCGLSHAPAPLWASVSRFNYEVTACTETGDPAQTPPRPLSSTMLGVLLSVRPLTGETGCP